ncbi:MAG: flagellar hook-basal body complex protein [Deltaproteobacteria bacterium]|nr:flagellar hook-basal body complex protein [Deltaproteobacteria bacterium]
MALSSALYSGISGLGTLGSAMQIIGDNIANVNTVGYKNSTFTFQDLLSQSTATMSGTAQVGRGTALGDIYASYSQGSFESTENSTDLAIGGAGFFILRESGSENLYYSRAGNFRFDDDGYLINPEGYVVQGWELDENGEDVGSTADLLLDSFTSPPQESTQIRLIANLDSDAVSQTSLLSNVWDGTSATPISSSNYEYQSTVKVYDSLGSTHDITTYFDKVSDSEWEYIVTCNPSEDSRSGFSGTTSAGLLARGQITFSQSSGTMTDMSMETIATPGHTQDVTGEVYGGTGGITADNTTITIDNEQALNQTFAAGGAGDDFLLTYTAATTSWAITDNAGYAGAVIVAGDADGVTINLDGAGSPATDITIAFDSSLTGNDTLQFDIYGSPNWTAAATNTNGYFEITPDFIGGSGTAMNVELNMGTQDDGTGSFVNDSLTTTQFARASTTTFQSANGYGAGDLQGVSVDVDGVITGTYSNGELIPLFRVALAKFQNNQGLQKEGGNLYTATRESGDAITNRPGTNGLGDISPNALEQSNVDMATEFVKMITTQRGFQANSKIITVTDSMLSELINLKR